MVTKEANESLVGERNPSKIDEEEIQYEDGGVSSALLYELFNDIQPLDQDMLFDINPHEHEIDFSGLSYSDTLPSEDLKPSVTPPDEGSPPRKMIECWHNGNAIGTTMVGTEHSLRQSQSLRILPHTDSLNPTLLGSFSHGPDLTRSQTTPNLVRGMQGPELQGDINITVLFCWNSRSKQNI